MIEYRDVFKAFDQPVLSGVNLTVQSGEKLSVVGPSGTGKSVLLKTTLGLIVPDAGDVLIDGESVVHASREALHRIRRKVGYVFQYAALFDSMNVVENIAFPLIERYKLSRGEIMERVRDLLRRLDLANVDGIEEKIPPELSGGQRKRVGLARGIVGEPHGGLGEIEPERASIRLQQRPDVVAGAASAIDEREIAAPAGDRGKHGYHVRAKPAKPEMRPLGALGQLEAVGHPVSGLPWSC